VLGGHKRPEALSVSYDSHGKPLYLIAETDGLTWFSLDQIFP
jgi:hypothetical protein